MYKNFEDEELEEIDLDEEKQEEPEEPEVSEESEIDELTEIKLKYLKSLAEMENLRKKTEEEKKHISKYCFSSNALDILPTIDLFESAMKQEAPEEVKNWFEGFKMILANLKEALKNGGVNQIEVKEHEKFNHELHHAVAKEYVENLEPGHIVKVIQPGYVIHDRLLRPTTVVVSCEKEETKEQGENNE